MKRRKTTIDPNENTYIFVRHRRVDSILDQSNSSCGLQKHPEVVVVMWYVVCATDLLLGGRLCNLVDMCLEV